MIIYFIILILLLLFLFKIKTKKIKTDIKESPIKPIKKKNNVIEYFTNPKDQQCLRHSRTFDKAKNKLYKKLNENTFKNNTKDNINVHSEIKTEYDTMINSCKEYGENCKVHELNKLCHGLDHDNGNNCKVKGQHPNGGYLVQYGKIETESWKSLEVSNNHTNNLVSSNKLSDKDYNYEKVTPIRFIFNYESKFDNKFTDYIPNAGVLSIKKYKVKNYFAVKPIFNDIELLSKLLKCMYQFRELDMIYTDQDIIDFKKQENYDETDTEIKINSSNYIISKLEEINSRVNDMVSQDKKKLIINEIKTEPFPLEIIVEKYLWNFCKFKNNNIENTPRSIQNKINNNELSMENLEKACKKANGNFIKVPTLTKNDKNDRYYCIDKNNFTNSNTRYMEVHLNDKGKIINKPDFETDQKYNQAIKKSNKKIKNGIRSCDRIFDLQYDSLAKECCQKFNNNGCLGSTFNPQTKEYDVSMCINSNIKTDNENDVTNENEIKNKFYIINSEGTFIETIKEEYSLDFLDEVTSLEDYYKSITECSKGAKKKHDKITDCDPEYPPNEYIGEVPNNIYDIGFEKEDQNKTHKYIVKEKIVKLDNKETTKLYWEKI